MLVSEVLNAKATEGQVPAAEEIDFWTDCPTCHTTVPLSETTVETDDETQETTYRHVCGTTIVIISPPLTVPMEGRGYRLGDWVIRNPRDLSYQPENFPEDHLLFPASPHALD